MKCLILAGGMSSRMKKSSSSNLDIERVNKADNIAKGLIPIGTNQRPFMLYLMDNAKNAGIDEFVILLNEKDTSSIEILKPYIKHYQIQFAIQTIPLNREKPLGTADAVLQAMNQIIALQSEPFIVCNSDNLYSENAFKSLIQLKHQNAMIAYDRSTLNFPESKIFAFALCKFDANFELKSIVEKPEESKLHSFADPKGKYRVSMNIFKFHGKEFYSYFENCELSISRNEKEIPTAIMAFLDDKHSFYGIPLSEHVPDLTTKEDILNVEKQI